MMIEKKKMQRNGEKKNEPTGREVRGGARKRKGRDDGPDEPHPSLGGECGEW